MDENKLKNWTQVKLEEGPDLPLFQAEFRHMKNPRNGKVLKAIVLKAPDTVNMIAVTKDQELILVEQFRFGLNRLLLELPAGLMDNDEPPLEAAKRELLEETGFISESWTLLGKSYVNPAYVTNACYHFLALDAYHVGETLPDDFEDLKVHLIGIKSLKDISHRELLSDSIGQAAIASLERFIRTV